jgi:hypothetical protein
MVLKELAMHRIAYNLIRALMQRAALTYDVDLERISFKGSLDRCGDRSEIGLILPV